MTETGPDMPRLMAAMEATWPAAERVEQDGWRLRRGLGGGNRVSAASWVGPDAPHSDQIAQAETKMRAWDQRPIFWITPGAEALDQALAGRGYTVFEPVVYYAAPTGTLLPGKDLTAAAYLASLRPAIVEEIWREGGLGPARWAVMDRVTIPKRVLMGRVEDRPCGTGFVAVDGDVAMVHGLVVRPAFRRKGVAQLLMQAAAVFAQAEGATWLTLAVVDNNTPGRALYEKLGMRETGRYHYRLSPEAMAQE